MLININAWTYLRMKKEIIRMKNLYILSCIICIIWYAKWRLPQWYAKLCMLQCRERTQASILKIKHETFFFKKNN